ncbi:MAG: hypothetical protein J6Y78_00275 [Paludibacteraceae bacterium]|nr:hypothetical protein [Paludibacteraceae bacterium]
MTREEAIEIKGEILNKQGSVHVANSIVIDDVVRIADVIKIIDKAVTE